MQIYIITYHVEPTAASEQVDEYEGAFVNCFVESEDIHDALQRAEAEIEGAGWKVIDFLEAFRPEEEDLTEDNMQYYEQAKTDKEVLVFYAYDEEE